MNKRESIFLLMGALFGGSAGGLGIFLVNRKWTKMFSLVVEEYEKIYDDMEYDHQAQLKELDGVVYTSKDGEEVTFNHKKVHKFTGERFFDEDVAISAEELKLPFEEEELADELVYAPLGVDEEPDPDDESYAEIYGEEPDEEEDLAELDLDETVATQRSDGRKEWQRKVKGPKGTIFNISDEEFINTEEEFDKLTYSYYPKNDIFFDENGEEIENPEQMLGQGLLFFGLRSGSPDIVYIRNVLRSTDIEVIREQA